MHVFYVSEGLLTAEHFKRIDNSLWEFLWMISHETREGGKVLNGSPITIGRIAKELGFGVRTVKRHLAHLVKEGYIVRSREHSGDVYTYKIANSKKWHRAVPKVAPGGDRSGTGVGTNLAPGGTKFGTANKEDRQLDIVDNKPPYPPLPEVTSQWRPNGTCQPQRVSAAVARWHNNNAEFERAERAHERVMALARSLKANGRG
jgi:biotin operon repressor